MRRPTRGVPRTLFKELMNEGRLFRSPHFTLRALRAAREENRHHVSFVVSGKVARRAVDRNLLKRRGRAIVREALANEPHAWAIIFFARSGVTELPFAALRDEIVFLLRHARILP